MFYVYCNWGDCYQHAHVVGLEEFETKEAASKFAYEQDRHAADLGAGACAIIEGQRVQLEWAEVAEAGSSPKQERT